MCFSQMERKPVGTKFMTGMALCGVWDPGYFYLGSLPSPTCSSHGMTSMAGPSFAIMYACQSTRSKNSTFLSCKGTFRMFTYYFPLARIQSMAIPKGKRGNVIFIQEGMCWAKILGLCSSRKKGTTSRYLDS